MISYLRRVWAGFLEELTFVGGFKDGQNKSGKTGRRLGGPGLHRGKEARTSVVHPDNDKPCGVGG